MDIKKIKCSEIVDIRDGTHDSPKYQLEGYPLVTSKNIKNNKIDFTNVNLISEEDYNKINIRSSVDNGDILMPMIGTVGNPVLVQTTEKFAIKNVALFKLANNKNINNKYFYYLLNSNVVKQQLERNKRGGTQNFVSLTNIRELIIPLISIERQKYIATVLDKAQELIDKRKAQIEALDELVKSQFIEMFGDPNMNNKRWNQRKISEICENKDSNRVPLKQADRDKRDGEYPYYGATGIIDYIDDYIFEGLYLLIAEDGKNLETKNKDIAFLAQDKFWVNNHAHVVSETKESNLYYLKHVINNINLKPYITGIDQLKLNRSNLDKIVINVPPIELQNKFADFVKQTDKLKFEMQESLKALENNFNSLMQKAFKVELFTKMSYKR